VFAREAAREYQSFPESWMSAQAGIQLFLPTAWETDSQDLRSAEYRGQIKTFTALLCALAIG
jgi:hypothetical protein